MEDDLDDEERDRIAQVELAEEERKKRLYESQCKEDDLKKERKLKAKAELDTWELQRKKQIE